MTLIVINNLTAAVNSTTAVLLYVALGCYLLFTIFCVNCP